MKLTHLDDSGNPTMVDIAHKNITQRKAVAKGEISMNEACFEQVSQGYTHKGQVMTIAQVAGIMGAKKTADLIPLCHPISLTKVHVTLELSSEKKLIIAYCEASCTGMTGVEMEALMGVNVALLTIYDMCKAIDKEMIISNIHLIEKTGGKSGDFYNSHLD